MAERIVFNVRIDPELKAQMAEAAKRSDRGLQEFAVQALREACAKVLSGGESTPLLSPAFTWKSQDESRPGAEGESRGESSQHEIESRGESTPSEEIETPTRASLPPPRPNPGESQAAFTERVQAWLEVERQRRGVSPAAPPPQPREDELTQLARAEVAILAAGRKAFRAPHEPPAPPPGRKVRPPEKTGEEPGGMPWPWTLEENPWSEIDRCLEGLHKKWAQQDRQGGSKAKP